MTFFAQLFLMSWSVSVAGGQCVEMEGLDWGWELTPGDTLRRQARGLEGCQRLCVYWTPCRASSFHPSSHLCVLSPHPPSPLPSTSGERQAPIISVLRNSTQCQNPCHGRPCGDTESCVPSTGGTQFICVPLSDGSLAGMVATTQALPSQRTTAGDFAEDTTENLATQVTTEPFLSTTQQETSACLVHPGNVTCPPDTQALEGCYQWCIQQLPGLVTLQVAKQQCEAVGLQVLTAENKEKMEAIKQTLQAPADRIWLGAKRETLSEWRWTALNQTVVYSDWNPGEPSTTTTAVCMAMNHLAQLAWHNINCDRNYTTVCQVLLNTL